MSMAILKTLNAALTVYDNYGHFKTIADYTSAIKKLRYKEASWEDVTFVKVKALEDTSKTLQTLNKQFKQVTSKKLTLPKSGQKTTPAYFEAFRAAGKYGPTSVEAAKAWHAYAVTLYDYGKDLGKMRDAVAKACGGMGKRIAACEALVEHARTMKEAFGIMAKVPMNSAHQVQFFSLFVSCQRVEGMARNLLNTLKKVLDQVMKHLTLVEKTIVTNEEWRKHAWGWKKSPPDEKTIQKNAKAKKPRK